MRSARLTEAAPAKVNLYLHVTGRRPDGYHLLDSLVVFADCGDRLDAAPGPGLSLAITGPMASALSAEPDNLVLRAARTLAVAHGIPADAVLTLEKRLPVASGIGGGSSDAAAALRLLGRMWGVQADPRMAQSLGADVPVCLHARAARMRGIGERLEPAPGLPEFGLLLANPGVPVATASVFHARAGGWSEEASLPVSWPDAGALARDLAGLRNDLESPAIALCPEIGALLQRLRKLSGCLLARMSGSGATCYALFATPEAARLANAALTDHVAWSAGGGLHRG